MHKGRQKRTGAQNASKKVHSRKPKSPLDINQIELAFINRALSGRLEELPEELEISNIPRIQKIQKYNLERLCKKLKKETDKELLEKELLLLLEGEKCLNIFGFGPFYKQKNQATNL